MAFKGPFRLGTDPYDGAEWVSDSLGQTVYTAQCPDLLNTLTAERDALKAEREEMREKLREFHNADVCRTARSDGEFNGGRQVERDYLGDRLTEAFPFLTEEPKR